MSAQKEGAKNYEYDVTFDTRVRRYDAREREAVQNGPAAAFEGIISSPQLCRWQIGAKCLKIVERPVTFLRCLLHCRVNTKRQIRPQGRHSEQGKMQVGNPEHDASEREADCESVPLAFP